MIRQLVGDVRVQLPTLPDASVQCVVTSPPYWGLRDYGTAQWVGGQEGCAHAPSSRQGKTGQRADRTFTAHEPFRDICGHCGAARVDPQLGLERTPDEYVHNLVSVFREVRRVLRDDGTLWLNLGDSYVSGTGAQVPDNKTNHTTVRRPGNPNKNGGQSNRDGVMCVRLSPKNLVGIPWRVAFALQADGWYLRSEIIWAKPNPMPESVTDRPTKAHEQIFLLAKSERYYYDADAIAEPVVREWDENNVPVGRNGLHVEHGGQRNPQTGAGLTTRNRRSVWTVATQPFSQAHFATFPPKLIEPCILAGSARQSCEHCGAPWARVVERENGHASARATDTYTGQAYSQSQSAPRGPKLDFGPGALGQSLGFTPTCSCPSNTGSARSVVLDPFGGAGTTGLVADRLGRDATLIELNPAYAQMLRNRIVDDAPLFAKVAE